MILLVLQYLILIKNLWQLVTNDLSYLVRQAGTDRMSAAMKAEIDQAAAQLENCDFVTEVNEVAMKVLLNPLVFNYLLHNLSNFLCSFCNVQCLPFHSTFAK